MRRRAVASTFLSYPLLLFQFPFTRLVIAIVAFAAFFSAASLAQQLERPQATEPASVIRLRQQWFYRQRAYPNRHIPVGARLKAFQQLRKMEAAQRTASRQLKQQTTTSTVPATSSTTLATTLSSTPWTLIGPQPTATPFAFNPVSGRVTALAVDPTNSNIVYLGGAEGGVWKTTDGGTTWTPLTDHQPSLAIGSIAIDPENPQMIYAGTGEADFALYNYNGAGVLKSTDGGSTWNQLAGPFVGPFGSQSPYCGGAYIGSLAVDPGNSQVILAGAIFNCNAGSGVYRSTDGGTSWTEVLGTSQMPDVVTGLVFDPANGNNVYAAVGNPYGSSNNGIWKSTNAGLTWTLDNGSGTTAFPGSTSGRISLAIAPSSPTTLYAGAASAASNSSSLLGVYKTTDGGASWTQLAGAPQYCSPQGGSQQCFFDNVVGVSPTDPNIVLLGGSEAPSSAGYAGTLYLSLDGGTTWTDITTDSSGNAIHPDMHSLAFSADGSTLYAGNDGGLWRTPLGSTGAGTWTNLNQPLALTQFYPGMSLDPTNPNNAFAGSQDNGIQEYNGSLTWGFVGCGDGGQTAFDYSTLNSLYIGCQYAPPNTYPFLYKLTANPPTAMAADNGIDGTDRGGFIPPLTMDPSNPNTLYFGTYRVYQTTDGGSSWKPISYDLTSGGQTILSTISAITVAPSDSNTVYAGTGDGRLWVTTNATSGAGWYSILSGIPNRWVTAIAVNPMNPQTAYATFSGYSGFGDTLGHVFGTTSEGSSWTDISGNLPNIPVNDIVVDPDFPSTLYIATDIGVFATSDGGATWAPLGTGLPAVAVMSLKLQRASRILRAASYGRSAWDIQLPAPVGPTAVLSSPTLDFAAQQVGTTSAAQTVTLTNNSSTALTISSITASTSFAETNTCGTSLEAGANCTISVTFTPAALGPQTGTVTITDNAASGSPQTVALSGKGFSGAVSLSPTTLAFADQLVGTTSAAQTVTLTNSSTTPLTIATIIGSSDFTVTSDCPYSTTGALTAGASCHINISFAPRTMGTLVEQVTITDSAANSPQAIPVSGNGIAPVVTLNPPSLNFNPLLVGASSSLVSTLTNTGTADLAINAINVLDPTTNPLTESDSCPRSPSPIPPQSSCSITVTSAPTKWGQYGGRIEIDDNALSAPQYLSAVGYAYSGTASLSTASLTFTSVPLGQTSQPQSIRLTNSGSSPLYVSGIGPLSSPWAETDDCPRGTASLAPSASCTINITYTPVQTGTTLAWFDVNDSSSNSFSQQVALSGSGTGADVYLNPTILQFGSQSVGTTSVVQNVTVSNDGNENLTLSNIGITGINGGDFAIATGGTTCSIFNTLAPKAQCAIQMAFKPAALGSRIGNLTISDNAYNSPQNVSLAGTGSAGFVLAAASGTSSTATVAVGGTASYQLTVAPIGNFNQTVALACSGAPSRATCTVSPASVTLDGTNAQNVKVTVTTAAPGLLPPGPSNGPPLSGDFAISYWWIALLMLIGSLALAFDRRRRVPLLAGAVLLAAILLSCGGGGGGSSPSPGTPAGTYTLKVTGTSGNLSHQTSLTLTVQ